jgi:hypothetical protein
MDRTNDLSPPLVPSVMAGPVLAIRLGKAVEFGERHRPNLAVLDIRLAEGGVGTDIAARLNRPDSLGVLYATGHLGGTGLTKAMRFLSSRTNLTMLFAL